MSEQAVLSEPGVVFKVDLRWSLWSAHRETWEEHAPEALKHMVAIFESDDVPADGLLIRSSPKREIRYGSVRVRPKPDAGAVAEVHFCTEWDDLNDLADLLGVDTDDGPALDALSESLPRHTDGIGWEVSATVEGRTLEELLKNVDAVEARLLEEDHREWSAIEASYREKS